MEVVWTKLAIKKLNAFVDYIAKDDFETAKNWANSVLFQTDKLIEQPEIGRVVPEFNNPIIRELIIGNYRIIYRIRMKENKLVILTVRHVRQSPLQSV